MHENNYLLPGSWISISLQVFYDRLTEVEEVGFIFHLCEQEE